MTPAERSLLITLARIVREDIRREERGIEPRIGKVNEFNKSEIDVLRKMMDEEGAAHRNWPGTPSGCQGGEPAPDVDAGEFKPRVTEGYRPRPAAVVDAGDFRPSLTNEAVLELELNEKDNAIRAAFLVLIESTEEPGLRICRAVMALAPVMVP